MSTKVCHKCGIRPTRKGSKNPNTKKYYYRKYCAFCEKHPELSIKKSRQTTCSLCYKEFLPPQLDLDHADGDSTNNRDENLKIICSNCHRIKTHIQKDYINKENSNDA